MLEWFFLFLQIMLINIVLSGDNAMVIAMASKNLPDRERQKAIWWGAFGAVGMRLILTVVAVTLLSVPYLQAAGALLLFWIAIKLLVEDNGYDDAVEAATLGKAIRTIIAADFVMSLDNVLAIAAKADNDLLIVLLGIGCSIPIIIWGSSAVAQLLNRFPVLVYIGAGILGYTAGEMFIKDPIIGSFILREHHPDHWVIPVTTMVVVLAAGFFTKRTEKKK